MHSPCAHLTDWSDSAPDQSSPASDRRLSTRFLPLILATRPALPSSPQRSLRFLPTVPVPSSRTQDIHFPVPQSSPRVSSIFQDSLESPDGSTCSHSLLEQEQPGPWSRGRVCSGNHWQFPAQISR